MVKLNSFVESGTKLYFGQNISFCLYAVKPINFLPLFKQPNNFCNMVIDHHACAACVVSSFDGQIWQIFHIFWVLPIRHSFLSFLHRHVHKAIQMAKLLLSFYLLILGSSLQLSSSSNWWSPYEWREYWEDWWQKLDIGQSEGLLQPQQSKPEILPNGEG